MHGKCVPPRTTAFVRKVLSIESFDKFHKSVTPSDAQQEITQSSSAIADAPAVSPNAQFVSVHTLPQLPTVFGDASLSNKNNASIPQHTKRYAYTREFFMLMVES